MRKLLACLIFLLLFATACYPAPEQGTVVIVGDSITYQARGSLGDDFNTHPGLDVETVAFPGYKFSDVQEGVDARATGDENGENGRPETLVIALGANNATIWMGDGWTAADDADLDLLVNSVSPDTCIAFILPGRVLKPGVTQAEVDQYASARWSMLYQDQNRDRTVLVDWNSTIQADWSLTYSDGLHLSGMDNGEGWWLDADTASAEAYRDHIGQGIDLCQAELGLEADALEASS